MKTICLFLLTGVVLLSCNSNKENKSSEGSKQTEITSDITGNWWIKTYHPSPITAMDDSQAREWLNQEITIDSKVHFNFENISSYRELFKNQKDCNLNNATSPFTIKAEQYFEPAIIKDLKLAGTNIKVYRADCPDNPFHELALTKNNELIIYWDGVYFRSVKE